MNTIDITARDLRTVQALESLAAVQPEARRAAHLVGKARELAGRMKRALEDTVHPSTEGA